MLRGTFQYMWERLQPDDISAGNFDPVRFRHGINMLEQSEDPFREHKPRESNALVRLSIALHDVYTEVVALNGVTLYYGIHHSCLSQWLTKWHCVRRLTRGDRLWNILQEADGWRMSFLSPVSMENLVSAERDAAGDFMEDPVWKIVRTDDNTTYIIRQEG